MTVILYAPMLPEHGLFQLSGVIDIEYRILNIIFSFNDNRSLLERGMAGSFQNSIYIIR